MVRKITGGRHRWLLPVSAMVGALLLVIAVIIGFVVVEMNCSAP
jgi:iron complex transport system permease protein